MRKPLPDRRSFLAAAAALTSRAMMGAEATQPASVRVDSARVLGRTPKDFLGFGYEISSVAVRGLLSDANRTLVQYYRNLGTEGVVRIGGNTSDFSSWDPEGEAVSSPQATITNRTVINDLGRFLDATGWKLIWGLNLGSGSVASAVDQATAVLSAAGDRLLCFQIGNEPDLFVASGHRPSGYGYSDYQREASLFAAAIRERLPTAPLAGPDVAGATGWVAAFAQDQRDHPALLTEHYYRAGQKQPAATFTNLLHTDPRFVDMTDQLRADSRRFGIPYRLVELNSFSGGGKPGVSDTFASALWALDLMYTLSFAEGSGINLETGVNQLGFVSSYSPIFEDGTGVFSARPSYYAMLAFSLAGIGQRLDTAVSAPAVNVTAYAVRNDDGKTWLTVINKDLASAAQLAISGLERSQSATVMRLTAPAFDSTTGAKLADAEVSGSGSWKPAVVTAVRPLRGGFEVRLPIASALLIRFS